MEQWLYASTSYLILERSDENRFLWRNIIFFLNCIARYQIDTVKVVCNDHLYDKIYYLWFIQ